jgi:hypothetical protein
MFVHENLCKNLLPIASMKHTRKNVEKNSLFDKKKSTEHQHEGMKFKLDAIDIAASLKFN